LLNIQFAKPFHSLLFYVPLRHAGFMPALVRARDLQEIARKTTHFKSRAFSGAGRSFRTLKGYNCTESRVRAQTIRKA